MVVRGAPPTTKGGVVKRWKSWRESRTGQGHNQKKAVEGRGKKRYGLPGDQKRFYIRGAKDPGPLLRDAKGVNGVASRICVTCRVTSDQESPEGANGGTRRGYEGS